ncbi:MAG: 3'-5' exoribonuclease YhaM family protein [Candidatus Zixiibacteriota bacterium]
MDSKLITDFVVGDTITGFFGVRNKEIRDFTRGRYVKLEIGDSSGRILANIWEPDQFAMEDLTEGMVVKARGTVTEFNHKLQLKIDRIRLAEDSEYSLEAILPHSDQSPEERRARIVALADKIEDSYVSQLTSAFLDDEQWFERFLQAAAGKLWHHATVGGLSEHSANVAELALRVASGYDFLNRDYLIFGGIFHDAGKMDTYKTGASIDYTSEGRLIGHICLADVWVCERASKIEDFPPGLLMKLRHMILSHQGQLEYSTPIVPQMPEAFVLYYCDEIDSKMGAIDRIRRRHTDKGWSEWVNLLGRHLYFGEDSDG